MPKPKLKDDGDTSAGVFDLYFDACMTDEMCNDLNRSMQMQDYGSHVFLVESVLDTDSTNSAAAFLRRLIRDEAEHSEKK